MDKQKGNLMKSAIHSALLSLAVIATPLAIADVDNKPAEKLSEQRSQQLNQYFATLADNGRFIGTAAIYHDEQPLYQITIQPDNKADKGDRKSVV